MGDHDMQEQDGMSFSSSRLRMIVGLVVTVILLWILLWLIFFRTSSPKPTSSHSSTAKQQQSPTSQSNSNSNNASSGPSQLANTGAGNVIALVAGASVVGGVLYQVRLRKNLSR